MASYNDCRMSFFTAASIVSGALRDALPVNPWLAALWFLSALVLAALLVYAWGRLVRDHR
jgi:membrane protein DedA with SNARE-associated domain